MAGNPFAVGRARGRTFLAIVTLLGSVSFGASAQTPIALSPLEGDVGGVAFAINDRGEAAGVSDVAGTGTRAVIWDRNGIPRELSPLGDTRISQAEAINNRGQAAGWSYNGRGFAPVVWDPDGAPTALTLLAGTDDGLAFSINSSGEVAGRSGEGVVWDRKGTPRALPPLDGGFHTDAHAINSRGEVAGWSFGPSPSLSGENIFSAVVWDSKRTPMALGFPDDANNCFAFAINDRGQVAGRCSGIGTGPKAVIWNRDGIPMELPDLSGGVVESSAFAINNSGEVTGDNIFDGAQGAAKGVKWGPDGSPRELPPFGGDTSSNGYGINSRGMVVGVSSSDTGNTAVVWRPEWHRPSGSRR